MVQNFEQTKISYSSSRSSLLLNKVSLSRNFSAWMLSIVAFMIPFGSWQEIFFFGQTAPRIAIPCLFTFLIIVSANKIYLSSTPALILTFAALTTPSLIIGDELFFGVFLNFLGYAMLAVLLLNSVNSIYKLYRIILAYYLGACVITLFCLIALVAALDVGEYVGFPLTREVFGVRRIIGTEENQNAFAAYFIAALPISGYMLIHSRGKFRFLTFLVAVAFAVTVILTFSRAAILGSASALLIFFAYRQSKFFYRAAMLGSIATLGVAMIFATELFNLPLLAGATSEEDILRVISDKQLSAGIREELLGPLVDILSQNPFFGVGYGHLPALINDRTGQFLGAHNIILGIAIDLGIFALLAFAGLVSYIALVARKEALIAPPGKNKDIAACLFGILMGLLVNGLAHEAYISFLLWMIIAMIGTLPFCRYTVYSGYLEVNKERY